MTLKCKERASSCVIFPPSALYEEEYDGDDNYTFVFQGKLFKSIPEFRMKDEEYYGVFCVECSEFICHKYSQFIGASMVPMSEYTGIVVFPMPEYKEYKEEVGYEQ